MGSKISISLSGFDDLKKDLSQEPQNQIEAMIKAQTKVASLSVNAIKDKLRVFGGREPEKGKPRDPSYRNSKKGDYPLKHSGRLEGSIFFKNLANKRTVATKIGSGVGVAPIEYAKYLEGRKGDGIRPFLKAADKVATSEKVMFYFDKYYKPLQGGK